MDDHTSLVENSILLFACPSVPLGRSCPYQIVRSWYRRLHRQCAEFAVGATAQSVGRRPTSRFPPPPSTIEFRRVRRAHCKKYWRKLHVTPCVDMSDLVPSDRLSVQCPGPAGTTYVPSNGTIHADRLQDHPPKELRHDYQAIYAADQDGAAWVGCGFRPAASQAAISGSAPNQPRSRVQAEAAAAIPGGHLSRRGQAAREGGTDHRWRLRYWPRRGGALRTRGRQRRDCLFAARRVGRAGNLPRGGSGRRELPYAARRPYRHRIL